METWKLQDNAITRLRKWLEIKGLWNEELETAARSDIRRDVLTELAAAEKERKPALKSIFEDVYAELTEEIEE